MRSAEVSRKTKETDIRAKLCLDGSGEHMIETGVGFLDHMLTQIAVHGLFDLDLHVAGDLEVDAHHSVEDSALVLGQAFDQALGDRRGLVRMASATAGVCGSRLLRTPVLCVSSRLAGAPDRRSADQLGQALVPVLRGWGAP